MNLIQYSLSCIEREIPREILEYVFISSVPLASRTPASLHSRIEAEVIEKWIRVDCGLMGGTEVKIPLTGLPYQQYDNYDLVFQIPMERTQGRRITQVHSVNSRYHDSTSQFNYGRQGHGSTLLGEASALLDAANPPEISSTANVSIIGPNIILIKDDVLHLNDMYLLAIVSYDQEFSNVPPSHYYLFAQLAVMATKAYIYNNAIIRVDQGTLYGGMNLGEFKNMIDNYADAAELYHTMIKEEWQGAAVMADKSRHHRAIKTQLGRR